MTEHAPTPTINRPLSPHLSIYRWQISNTLSILHRLTGVALSVGSILLVAWLWLAAYSPECFAKLSAVLTTPFGLLFLVGWSFAFYYHLCNGIRHLFWDIGKGYSIPAMTRSGWLVVITSIALTAGTWFCIYNRGGFA